MANPRINQSEPPAQPAVTVTPQPEAPKTGTAATVKVSVYQQRFDQEVKERRAGGLSLEDAQECAKRQLDHDGIKP